MSAEMGEVSQMDVITPNVATASTTGPARATPVITCKRCDARWTASSWCHCTGCHETFTGLGLFDAHRRDVKGKGICLDPNALAGMRYADNAWRGPEMTDADKAKRGWA